MQCPECGGKGKCYATKYHDVLRVRYRRCPDCGLKFRTDEEIRDLTPLRSYRGGSDQDVKQNEELNT